MYSNLLHKPRNSGRFASLMELYEHNYMLMRLLIPELREMKEGCHVSRVPGAMTLELRDLTHSRYTSTFKLTYRFSKADSGRKLYEPDLDIRLYHDARSCEVMSGLLPQGRIVERRTRDLEEGRRLNRFLNRWLSYCLRQGHRFSTQPLPLENIESYCTQC